MIGPGRQWAGLALAIAAALAFAASVALAKIVYEGGGNPQAIIAVRLTFVFTGLTLIAAATGRAIRLPRRERAIGVALGVLLCFQTLSIYAAFLFMPVGLGVLVEYLYPLLVALAMWAVARERLAPVKLAALAAALAGLALALDVRVDGMNGVDPRGVLLALASALGLCVIIVASNQILRGADSFRLLYHMQGGGAVAAIVALYATGSVVFPRTPEGWLAILAIPVLNGGALFGLFAAMTRVGATRASLALAAEPIFVLLLGLALLGERLTPLQWAGAALIVGAIFSMQLWGARGSSR